MRRAYKFRVYPTERQEGRLAECLRDHRALYNAALEERRGRWKWNRQTVRYGDQSAQLKEIRSACPEQGRWSFSSQQATLRRLDKAMAAFFRRLKTGGKPGFPRFKGSDRFDSVEWPKDGDGCRWKPEHGLVYLQGIGNVEVGVHRPVEGVVKTITVKREGRRFYLVLSCDQVPAKPLPATGREVGVDLGIARFLTTSDGEVVANPKFARSSEEELTSAQRALARKRPGSENRGRARVRVAEVHRRVRRRRADFHHKVARSLLAMCDVLAFEALQVRNMSDQIPDYAYAKLRAIADRHLEALELAHRAGVPMALGTDVFTSGAGTVVPWGHNGEELTHLVAAGLSPLEAIEAATARAPLTLGPQAPRSGLLAEGYDADLIALAANPLDDITVLAEPANVTHVWKGGVPQKEAR